MTQQHTPKAVKLPLFVQPAPPKIFIATKSGEVKEIVLVCGEKGLKK